MPVVEFETPPSPAGTDPSAEREPSPAPRSSREERRSSREERSKRNRVMWRAMASKRANALRDVWGAFDRELAGRAPQRRKMEQGAWEVLALLDTGERAAVATVRCAPLQGFGSNMEIRVTLHHASVFKPGGAFLARVAA